MTGGCADGGLLDAAMISCSSDYRVLNGGFATLASFDDSHTYGEMTGGIAELLVHPAGIVTHLVVRGPAGQNFSAHLHAAPCASNGGPHYPSCSPNLTKRAGVSCTTIESPAASAASVGVQSLDAAPRQTPPLSHVSCGQFSFSLVAPRSIPALVTNV